LISSVAKPSTEIYTEQAQLNEKAATNAAQSGDNDWAVTICFYSAIHYVKAYASYKQEDIYQLYFNQNKPNTEHGRILDYVYDISYSNDNDRGLSFSAYETLFHASMKSRYLKGIRTTARQCFNINIDQYFEKLATVKKLFKINNNPIPHPATQRPAPKPGS